MSPNPCHMSALQEPKQEAYQMASTFFGGGLSCWESVFRRARLFFLGSVVGVLNTAPKFPRSLARTLLLYVTVSCGCSRGLDGKAGWGDG